MIKYIQYRCDDAYHLRVGLCAQKLISFFKLYQLII